MRQCPSGKIEMGITIITLTNKEKLSVTKPSDGYLRTIALGLKETYNLSNKCILEYLMNTPGIKGKFLKDKLTSIIDSAK